MKGKVKWYSETKGYGFIIGEDNQEYFMHITEIYSAKPLKKGEEVEFQESRSKKGLQAVKVKKSGE